MNRRDFLYRLGATGTLLATLPQHLRSAPATPAIQSIAGSWFEFQHHGAVEAVDWNPQCARFTCAQWAAKVREIAATGMEYLVLMATALDYRSFYPSRIFPQWQLACPDPLETVLTAADNCGVKFFIGAGFYGDWQSVDTISDPVAAKKTLQAVEEVTKRYGHHKSFYGWYWPNEAFIHPYFSEPYLHYANTCSKLARRLTPKAPILIAPYGTRVAKADDKYVGQLAALDVDLIAYQDEVGVKKSTPDETPRFYEALRRAHDRAQRSAIWADVEIFQFESTVYKSPALPASWERVLRQLEAVSPFVDKILVYQYLGMMNQPGSEAFCGPADSVNLYTGYMNWRRR